MNSLLQFKSWSLTGLHTYCTLLWCCVDNGIIKKGLYVEMFSSNHIPPKSLEWIIWKWHYCDIWISSNALSSINLNVSGTNPVDALTATIIIYNNYTKQSKTHLSAHDGLRWKSGTIKKQINKLLAEGSDLLYLRSFACDINWKSLY